MTLLSGQRASISRNSLNASTGRLRYRCVTVVSPLVHHPTTGAASWKGRGPASLHLMSYTSPIYDTCTPYLSGRRHIDCLVLLLPPMLSSQCSVCLQRKKELQAAQQQHHAKRLESLRKTSERAAEAEKDLRKGEPLRSCSSMLPATSGPRQLHVLQTSVP